MDDTKSKITALPNHCDWCGKRMPISNQQSDLVCSRCYRLLLDAGLSDETIFEKAVYKSGLLASSESQILTRLKSHL